jgi:DNA-binding response OmpR family regulator
MEHNKSLVLLVEADHIQVELIKLALSRLEVEVLATADAGEATQITHDFQPELIMVDTYLPHANGFDLIAQMKSDNILRETQVTFLSVMGFEEIVAQAGKLGAREFFVKPVDTDILVQRVAAILNLPLSDR